LSRGQLLNRELTPRFDDQRQTWNIGLEPWDTIVGLVQKGGPADRMGLQENDQILEIDGEAVTSFSAIAGIINHRADQEVTVVWERDGVQMQGRVIPEPAEILPDSVIGRIFIDHKYVYRSVSLGQGLTMGVRATWFTMKATLEVLYSFVGGKLGMEAVGGPIRIGQVAGEMLRWGFTYLMRFIAFFSVNLFLLNLLPIPVLDGGHVLFLFFEVLAGRRVPERVQAIATQVGLIILLLFMTFVLVVDVLKVTGH
jgi:regulator of sigma E protease